MTSIRNNDRIEFGPSVAQVVEVLHRADQVVAAVHREGRDGAQAIYPIQEQGVRMETDVAKLVGFQAGQVPGHLRLTEDVAELRVG